MDLLHGGATEMRSLYHCEIVNSNPTKATAICGPEPREQNWPYSLDGMDSMLSVNHSNTRHVCRKEQKALFSECIALHCRVLLQFKKPNQVAGFMWLTGSMCPSSASQVVHGVW